MICGVGGKGVIGKSQRSIGSDKVILFSKLSRSENIVMNFLYPTNLRTLDERILGL